MGRLIEDTLEHTKKMRFGPAGKAPSTAFDQSARMRLLRESTVAAECERCGVRFDPVTGVPHVRVASTFAHGEAITIQRPTTTTDRYGNVETTPARVAWTIVPDNTPPETMQRMMDVNFMGTFHGARAALPVFRAQSRGHLIVISSIVGHSTSLFTT